MKILLFGLFFQLSFFAKSSLSQLEIGNQCTGTFLYDFGAEEVFGDVADDDPDKTNLTCENFIKNGTLIKSVSLFLIESQKLNKKIRLNTANYDFYKIKVSTTLGILFSNFSLFMNGSQIFNETDCNRKMFRNKSTTFFKEFTNLNLSALNYQTKICPLIFHLVQFKTFTIDNQDYIDDIIFMNNVENQYNATIRELIFGRISSLKLRKQFLNISLFKDVERISIEN